MENTINITNHVNNLVDIDLIRRQCKRDVHTLENLQTIRALAYTEIEKGYNNGLLSLQERFSQRKKATFSRSWLYNWFINHKDALGILTYLSKDALLNALWSGVPKEQINGMNREAMDSLKEYEFNLVEGE